MVGRDYMTGTGHILNDEFGIARNMLPHVDDDETGPQVIEIAGWRADYNPNGFSLIEGSLGMSADAPQQQAQNRKDKPFHIAPPRDSSRATVIAAGTSMSNLSASIGEGRRCKIDAVNLVWICRDVING